MWILKWILNHVPQNKKKNLKKKKVSARHTVMQSQENILKGTREYSFL